MAAALCVLALLPISMGALVTTLKAGMAFADWPTSDGQNMLLYPWLQDLSDTDKFTEHGHRLAGMLLGFYSIALVVTVHFSTRIRWVRRYSLVVLAAVIAQGILGGARVLQNQQTLAMVHSLTGAAFFCVCVGLALGCSNVWRNAGQSTSGTVSTAGLAAGVLLPLAILGQYVLGSFFRHLHILLDEHLVGAVMVSLLTIGTVVSLRMSSSRLLQNCAAWLLAALSLQIVLGLGSYVTRLGFKPTGYVAIQGSFLQSALCSAHTVGGMLLLASAVSTAAVLLRIARTEGTLLFPMELVGPGADLRAPGHSDGGAA